MAWHGVALGIQHSFTLIIPDNQKAFANDPRFSQRLPDGRVFATIGAGPEFPLPPFGHLISGVNRSTDIDLKSINGSVKLQNPAVVSGKETEDQLISKLFSLNSQFNQSLVYELFPDDVYGTRLVQTFNSNSFTHGLLDAAGFQDVPSPPDAPGFDKPVPEDAFSSNTNRKKSNNQNVPFEIDGDRITGQACTGRFDCNK